jgi:hypothetical protein
MRRVVMGETVKAPPLPGPLPHSVAERQESTSLSSSWCSSEIAILARQEMEFGSAGGSEGVYGELVRLQLGLPGFDEPQHGGNVQMFVNGRIFLEVGFGKFEQGG